jgi:phosphoribosylamine--glycine ligase
MSPRPKPSDATANRGPARLLVLGSGGREHTLVWSLAREAAVEAVVVAPGSDAIGDEPKVRCVPAVSATDPAAVVALATRERADLVVVGPEAPLAAGVADALLAAGVPTFGPTRAAARIEWSKAFCRDVAAAAGVRITRRRHQGGRPRGRQGRHGLRRLRDRRGRVAGALRRHPWRGS